MTIEERLERALDEQQKIVTRLNAIEQEKQGLLQEALKLEGEIRVLKDMEEKE